MGIPTAGRSKKWADANSLSERCRAQLIAICSECDILSRVPFAFWGKDTDGFLFLDPK